MFATLNDQSHTTERLMLPLKDMTLPSTKYFEAVAFRSAWFFDTLSNSPDRRVLSIAAYSLPLTIQGPNLH